ncbi:putative Chromo domain protein Chp1p [Aspergillus affinis]|uniref:putative Chromo domain protein Chp1p n=1 Tax=Aspergillus affinis TaxID=1070780 RepID=UPI0022FE7977|nr:uncharacterized protein KD926_010889 [Aspergillus affinis]KAI9038353.1 hypothetical protein KD926_010889 [Aspergillus affinis]
MSSLRNPVLRAVPSGLPFRSSVITCLPGSASNKQTASSFHLVDALVLSVQCRKTMAQPAATAAAVSSSSTMSTGAKDEFGDHDDSISTTSTLSSEQQSEYEVETVFAEKQFPDGMRYLVKWAGYPMSRCSWEPEECFNTPVTLLEWCQKKRAIHEGKAAPFDHNEWQREQDAQEQAKLNRRQRRDEKRKRNQLRARNRSNPTSPTMATAERPDLHNRPQSPSRVSVPSSHPRIRASPPPVLFGGGQSNQRTVHPLRLRRPNDEPPTKHFNLSTKRRYEKAKTDEAAPNINQMKLIRPSEFPPRSSVSAVKTGFPEGPPKTEKAGESSMRNGTSSTYGQHPAPPLIDSSLSTRASSDVCRSRPSQGNTSEKLDHLGDREELVLPERVPGPRSYVTYNKRFFNPDEVLVNLYYGPEKKDIGDARLCGLTPPTKSRILNKKKDASVEIWFQHLCTLDDYQRLCYNTGNQNFCTGWIEGFNDTEQNVFRMAQDLGQRGLLAVSIPDLGFQNVLLAYPPDSRDFSFLQNNFNRRPESCLYFTARSHLNPIELGLLDGRTKKNQAFTRIQPRLSIHSPVNETPSSTNAQGKTPNHCNAKVPEAPALPLPHRSRLVGVEPHETQGASHVNPILSPSFDKFSDSFGEPMALDYPHPPPIGPASPVPSSDHEPSLPGTGQDAADFDLNIFFQKQYGVTFSMLLDSKQTAGFYVMYPGLSGNADQQCDEQCEILMAFLQKHTSQTYSSRQSKDWETFTLMERGVALFHENFVDFASLPSLNSLLLKNITFWSFSLFAPHEYAGHPAHFQRIFPHGCIFLLPEDAMLRKLEKTIAFLAWFRDSSKKKFPGTWKLMVRPNILEWVLKQYDRDHPSRRALWITMHFLISDLGLTANVDIDMNTGVLEKAVISPNLPSYSSSSVDDQTDNANGLNQEHRKADRLAEFFAGWALVNRHQFRRFVIVSGIEPPERWKTWQHMIIYHGYRATMATYKIDYELHWSKLGGQRGGPSTEDKMPKTPSAFTPQAPRASGSRSEQPSITTPMTHDYPQPYK